MTPTQKLEKDPYYSTGRYLVDIFENINTGNIDKAKRIIEDAKLFDLNYYIGVLPRYNEIVEIYLENNDINSARLVLIDAKNKNNQEFFKRGYLDLFEINKKIGKKDENVELLKEALRVNPDSFYEFGYKKLIEMLMEKEEYEKAREVLDRARNYSSKNVPSKNGKFSMLEDSVLYDQLSEKIRNKIEERRRNQKKN